MELDQNKVKQILAMDDGALTQTVQKVLEAIGTPQSGAMRPEDLAKFRAMLRSVRQEDLEKLSSALGTERANAVIRALSESGDGHGL